MNKNVGKQVRRSRRRIGIRKRISGTATRPRLSIYKSLNHIYAQVIDDTSGTTLAAASSLEQELRTGKGNKSQDAAVVGRILANRAKTAGVERVVFDRGGYRYHGRVKSLAEAAREAGLDF